MADAIGKHRADRRVTRGHVGQAKRTPCSMVRQALPEKVTVEKRLKQVREE